MLFRSGAYRWQCTADELATMGIDDYCTKQYNSVNNLLIVAQSCEYIFGVIAGISLDRLGPFITGSVAIVMHLVGVILYMYSRQQVVAYVPATIFFAGAINMACFPMLALADMFPKWKGLVMSIIVAAQLVSTMMGPVLKAIWDANPRFTFKGVFGGYLAFCFLPLSVFYILCLPMSRPDLAPEEADVSGHDIEIAHHEVAQPAGAVKSAESPNSAHDIVSDSFIVVDGRKRRRRYTLWQQFASIDYIMFALWYIINIILYGYYPTTVLDQAGKNVSDFLGYIGPSQAVFGILLGLIVDYTLTMPIAVALNVMVTVLYFFALIKSVGMQYLTAVIYTISNSYIYTTKYTYVGEIYPKKDWGTLIGTMGAAAGFMNLINIPIQNANAYVSTCIAYGIIAGFCLFILMWLWNRNRKGINYLDIE